MLKIPNIKFYSFIIINFLITYVIKIYLVVDNLVIFTIFLWFICQFMLILGRGYFFIIFYRFHVYLKAIIDLEDFILYVFKLLVTILNLMHLSSLLNNISYFYHIFFVLFAFSKNKTTIIFLFFKDNDLKLQLAIYWGDPPIFFSF